MTAARPEPARTRAAAALVAAVAAAALLAGPVSGCGEDDAPPGERPPKRSVEPRTEVLRFFPAGTGAVALVRVLGPDRLRELDSAMEPVALWRQNLGRLERSLGAAGIDAAEILMLAREPRPELELPTPEIAAGAVAGAGAAGDRMLYALATERGVALHRIFSQAAEEGGLEAAGELDEARLFRGPGPGGLDFAVRDGVLIAASGIERLQQAIVRRDGAESGQLDEAAVNGVLNDLAGNDPLHGHLSPSPAADAAISALAGRLAAAARTEEGAADRSPATDEPAPNGEPELAVEAVGVGIAGDGRGLRLDLVAELAEAPPRKLLPSGEEEVPVPLELTAGELREALAGAEADPVTVALVQLAPLAGAGWVEGDRIRARLRSRALPNGIGP